MQPSAMHQGPHPGMFIPGQHVMMPPGSVASHLGLGGVSGHLNHGHHPSLMPEHLGGAPPPCGMHPAGLNLDYRFCDLNKRLAQRPSNPDTTWWDEFVRDFFDDNAIVSVAFRQEDGPRRYTIGRTLIPRYFRSIFEGGITTLTYVPRLNREYFNQGTGTYALDSEQMTVFTSFGEPTFVDVQAFGRLFCEFGCEDMRIRHWNLAITDFRESVPKQILGMHLQDPGMMESLLKTATHQGLSKNHLNYLRLCVILEPMQELMSKAKAYPNMSPRECLTTTLFQKWRSNIAILPQVAGQPPQPLQPPMLPPPEAESGRPIKRRKKRGSSSGASTPTPAATGGKKGKSTTSPAPLSSQAFPLTSSQVDVMVVGEPSLMGGVFGDEDERLISRLENNQYEPVSTSSHQQPNTSLLSSEAIGFGSHPGSASWLPASSSNSSLQLLGNFTTDRDIKPPVLSSQSAVMTVGNGGQPGSRTNSGNERKNTAANRKSATDASLLDRPSQSPLTSAINSASFH